MGKRKTYEKKENFEMPYGFIIPHFAKENRTAGKFTPSAIRAAVSFLRFSSVECRKFEQEIL